MLRRPLAPLVFLALAVLALGDPPKPAPKPAPPAVAPAPLTVFQVGKGKRYHLATCPSYR
jgi:hypothetical protein